MTDSDSKHPAKTETGLESHSISLWIGIRYLQLKRLRYHAFISWVSIIGLGLGVAILIVVLSVMNGFNEELSSRILGSVPHIVVHPNGKDISAINAEKRSELTQLNGVSSAFEFFQAEAIVTHNGGVNAVAVYGVPREQELPNISRNMISGALLEHPQSLVMGAPLAAYLGLSINDSIALVLTAPTQYGVRPEIRRFSLTGLFELGAELDYSVVIVNLRDIIDSNLLPTGEIGVRLVLDDPYSAIEIRDEIIVPDDWYVSDWTEEYGSLFQAVNLEKRMMFLLLLLIVAVAIFNIVASQTMVVNEKRSDIAILRTLGATSALILKVFLFQGVIISLIGITFGLILGTGLALNISEIVSYFEGLFGVRMLEGTYFNSLPSSLHVLDVYLITAVAFILCLCSAYLPAKRAAGLNPIDSLA